MGKQDNADVKKAVATCPVLGQWFPLSDLFGEGQFSAGMTALLKRALRSPCGQAYEGGLTHWLIPGTEDSFLFRADEQRSTGTRGVGEKHWFFIGLDGVTPEGDTSCPGSQRGSWVAAKENLIWVGGAFKSWRESKEGGGVFHDVRERVASRKGNSDPPRKGVEGHRKAQRR